MRLGFELFPMKCNTKWWCKNIKYKYNNNHSQQD